MNKKESTVGECAADGVKVATVLKISTDGNNNNKSDGCLFSHHGDDGVDGECERAWSVERSEFAKHTLNPIRRMLEQLKIEPNPQKQMISLSIGDPTVLSDMGKPDVLAEIIVDLVKSKQWDGYTPSFGTEKARQAVAKFYSKAPKVVYTAQDIILTHGCSHALDLAITVFANPGQNILIPRPGFSIYKTLANSLGIEERYYNLLPDDEWKVDLHHLASQVDANTVAIIVNNPSNPCGSVYTVEHLREIIDLAKRFRLPIIADEVYGEMVFANIEFSYLSELSDTVPIVSCNALSKRFILPGWRFGWIAIHDPKNILTDVRKGLMDLTTRILGPNSLVQAAVCELLEKTPQSYYDKTMAIVQSNADFTYNALSKLPGIQAKKPSGAMYMMVGIDFTCFPDLKDDQDFVQKLLQEQSVFCIPATSFCWPNYIRIVLTMKHESIKEACERISEFVLSHYRAPSKSI